MSRSRKKKPIASICNVRAGEMKYWKSRCVRKIRKRLMDQEVGNYSIYKRYTERWSAPDDGKFYAHKHSSWINDPKDIEKIKRK